MPSPEATPSTTPRPRRIFVIAGEASGDLHAANLIHSLKSLDPNLVFEGLGGGMMSDAGVELHYNMVRDLAIIGFGGIVRNYPKLRQLFRLVEERFKHHPPDAVLLVDYPGFNTRVARKAKERNLPVVYYICPQTWAWHESRAREFPHIFDKMLTIFPFEERLFRDYGVDATFVGHPLLDLLKITMTKDEACAHFGLDPKRPIITLLPGSRTREVKSLLPVMLDAAERLAVELPEAQFTLPLAPTISQGLIDRIRQPFNVPLVIAKQYRYNLRCGADFAWVASGTATLETALLGVPMVILYKISFLTWLVMKRLVNLPYIGLPNVLAGERIVPELLQDEATGQNLADRTLRLLRDPGEMKSTRDRLAHIRQRLEFPEGKDGGGEPMPAYERAAREVLQALDRLC